MLLLILTLFIAEKQLEGLFSFRDFHILGLLFASSWLWAC
jgi:hypothetical protein